MPRRAENKHLSPKEIANITTAIKWAAAKAQEAQEMADLAQRSADQATNVEDRDVFLARAQQASSDERNWRAAIAPLYDRLANEEMRRRR